MLHDSHMTSTNMHDNQQNETFPFFCVNILFLFNCQCATTNIFFSFTILLIIIYQNFFQLTYIEQVFNDAIEALRISYKKMNPFCVPFATTNMGSAMLAMDLVSESFYGHGKLGKKRKEKREETLIRYRCY